MAESAAELLAEKARVEAELGMMDRQAAELREELRQLMDTVSEEFGVQSYAEFVDMIAAEHDVYQRSVELFSEQLSSIRSMLRG